MENILLTLQIPAQEPVDLALPGHIPISELLPILLKSLGRQNAPAADTLADFSVRVYSTGQILAPDDTLTGRGIADGEVLTLVPNRPSTAKSSSTEGSSYLQASDGTIFPWSNQSAVVGCADANSQPDVDLRQLDPDVRTSRRHAQIWRRPDGQYWIQDLGSTNGTFVNGRELIPRKRVTLAEGAEIQFGQGGPTLIFGLGDPDIVRPE